jgi:hypothetical protein
VIRGEARRPRRSRPSCGPLAGRYGWKAASVVSHPDSVRSRSVRGPAVAPIDTPAVDRENRPTGVETVRVATGARLAARQPLGARTRSVPPDFGVEQLLASETAVPSVRRCVADKPDVAIANTRDRVRPESSRRAVRRYLPDDPRGSRSRRRLRFHARQHRRGGGRAVRHDRGDESRADRYGGDVLVDVARPLRTRSIRHRENFVRNGFSDPFDGAWRRSASRLATTAEQTRFYAAAG